VPLYHATPARNLEDIFEEGLDPGAYGMGGGTRRAHLHQDPWACAAFIEGLYREPVVVLEVDTDGLLLEPGDDDDELEWAYPGQVPPGRLRLTDVI